MIVAFDLDGFHLERRIVLRAQKHRYCGQTRTEDLGFDTKCSVAAQNG